MVVGNILNSTTKNSNLLARYSIPSLVTSDRLARCTTCHESRRTRIELNASLSNLGGTCTAYERAEDHARKITENLCSIRANSSTDLAVDLSAAIVKLSNAVVSWTKREGRREREKEARGYDRGTCTRCGLYIYL